MTPSQLFASALAHYQEALVDVGLVVAAASSLIKALEVLTALLVLLFPSLKTADGDLVKAAAFLDNLAKAKVLNLAALSPAKVQAAAKTAVLLLALVLFAPSPARASGFDYSTGPTIPLLEIRPGFAHPVSLAPGAGVQLSVTHDSLKRAFLGKSWDLLDLTLMAFGTVVSGESGASFGALSVAGGLGFFSDTIVLGVGHDVVDVHGGLGKWLFVASLSINFGLAPSSPPAGIESGAPGLPRANTVYFGAL